MGMSVERLDKGPPVDASRALKRARAGEGAARLRADASVFLLVLGRLPLNFIATCLELLDACEGRGGTGDASPPREAERERLRGRDAAERFGAHAHFLSSALSEPIRYGFCLGD